MLSQISIALQEEECQEKNDNNHDSQRSTAHSDGPVGRRQEVMVTRKARATSRNKFKMQNDRKSSLLNNSKERKIQNKALYNIKVKKESRIIKKTLLK